MAQKNQKLKLISPDKIKPNPENPRLIFRQEEMENLMTSISRIGIQVPITIYQDNEEYYLIDGERRWRCALKLNLKSVPALIQEKPTELENLLMMYNIHALREQWDYFTIASKLTRIIDLYAVEKGNEPNEIELSESTGLSRGQIRRCQLLINLPEVYKNILLEELELPKSQQKITEDFFIEMERSLKTITKRFPEFENRLDEIRNTLIRKFRKGIISAVTDFRQLSKIATSIENIDIAKKKAESALIKIFNIENEIGIKECYEETVEFEYDEQKAARQVDFLNDYFLSIIEEGNISLLDKDFLKSLNRLHKTLRKLLESYK